MADDLFFTGRAKKTKGGQMSIYTKGTPDIVKRLRKLEAGGQKAIERTVKDFSSRAPGWISKGIREHYGVDTAAIKEAAGRPKRGKASVNVAGTVVDGVTLTYRGRTLTPTHFKMSPKRPPAVRQTTWTRVPGQGLKMADPSAVAMIAPPKPYKIKATIIKGRRSTLPTGPNSGGAGAFLAEGKGGQSLPFQRTEGGRTPVEVIRTLSVPQMIEGRARETIQEKIEEGLEKRLENHIKQATR